MERYSGYSATITWNTIPETQELTQLNNYEVVPGTRDSAITPSGAIDRAHIGVAGADSVIRVASRDFVSFFTNMNIATGLNLTGESTFRWQERQDGGTFLTGTNHETDTVADGFLRPTQITASQDDDDGALLQCELTPLWNGSVDPIVHNSGVALGGSAPAFVSRFFLGPVYHNGAEIAGVTNVSVDPGIIYQARAFSGDPYPRKGAIINRNPTLTFTVAEMNAAGAMASIFGSAISTGVIFYLQRGVANGTRVAAGTAQHVKITASAGKWNFDTAQVTQNDDGSLTFSAHPTTTLALVTNSTIP